MSKIAIIVEFDIKPRRKAEFMELITNHAKRTLETEEGCLVFEILQPEQLEHKVFLYECYKDDEAFQIHRHSPVLAETRAKYEDMIIERFVNLCEVVE